MYNCVKKKVIDLVYLIFQNLLKEKCLSTLPTTSSLKHLAHFLSNTSALKKERQEELEPLVDRVTAFIASIAALLSP